MQTLHHKINLFVPLAFLILVTGMIVLDRFKTGPTHIIPSNSAENSSPQPLQKTVLDPVCRMEVLSSRAPKVINEGEPYFFCSTFCQKDFIDAPQRFSTAQDHSEGHSMRGIPTWMFQAGVGLLLLLSFGLFQFLSRIAYRKKRQNISAIRWDLTSLPGVRRFLKWPPGREILRGITASIFILIIVAGLFGNQNPAMNIAPLLTWTIWWAGLIFLILFFGKLWCTVCPWDAIASWMEKLKFWGPRKNSLSLGLPWPARLRNIWLAVGLFIFLTWIELGMGITLSPRATAWMGLGMLLLTIFFLFLFDRKAFCRYGCLVGRVSGLYALFSSVELRPKDKKTCGGCKTVDCFKGNDKGDGCPTFEFPKTMKVSTYCTLCTECIKTCPEDNISIKMRPWGSDLVQEGRPRADEAMLALILLSMTGFHGLTMTPIWPKWNSALQEMLPIPEWIVFSFLMSVVLFFPILLYGGLIQITSWLSKPLSLKKLFLNYAYALLPIALFYHLAHNAEHFLMEGPKIFALISDPMGIGWNLFGTAHWSPGPFITLEGLWGIQILLVIVGHLYSLWISEKTTQRLILSPKQAFWSQIPMLVTMILFSSCSLWLLKQPMEMRVSAM